MPTASPPAGYRVLRLGRSSECGHVYLLTTVACNRQPLFRQWEAATAVTRELIEPGVWPHVRLLCWVLMPDHWHGLVQLTDRVELAEVMRRMKGRTARAVNRSLGRTGPVWMPGFHDRGLRREENIVGAARYIVANPVRARLVARIGNYPFWDAAWFMERLERRG